MIFDHADSQSSYHLAQQQVKLSFNYCSENNARLNLHNTETGTGQKGTRDVKESWDKPSFWYSILKTMWALYVKWNTERFPDYQALSWNLVLNNWFLINRSLRCIWVKSVQKRAAPNHPVRVQFINSHVINSSV